MKNAVIAAVLAANALAVMLKGPLLYFAIALGSIIPAGLITMLMIWLLLKVGMASNRLSTVLLANGLSAVACVFLSWAGHGTENGFSIPLETLIGSSLFLMVLVLRIKKEETVEPPRPKPDPRFNDRGPFRRVGSSPWATPIKEPTRKWTSTVRNLAVICSGAVAFALVRWWMAPTPVHDQLVAAAVATKRDLPTRVDDSTTLRDVRVEGNHIIYVYDVNLHSIDTPTAS